MATYQTEISTGGGGWQKDADLVLSITNRNAVVPASGAPATGTTVTWSSTNGDGSVTFFDSGSNFQGTAQFPNEGPVGYRGRRVS
ncbi:hypothetical protein ABZ816_09265 [Actinosynnema sp. NPDC047251]|uniref:OAA-family lectin sugar binding domain-containing protein n=1 Tax=Saccharothrix espanaensis (strain ATCC 51144 / DSM 44229 / JCM 9112 / NBRC 15066 / NRRL 15764) TaxID=1179773 RepID=K0K188_SACES|nr:hypothetical protein [Saccharothrix espanaensis]CCH34000.1 hypothetical protein BN6_67630 [Saccharothrix espanaensis DSM 44229]